ncbi:MerR family transcriptional regulator [Leucobacter sp. USHLN153]|uniref:MerR family transcriptional regulator n=1 Tax=Leucobacter sp. USHLN153 TaxID=3081268 RepID=UPI003016A7C4
MGKSAGAASGSGARRTPNSSGSPITPTTPGTPAATSKRAAPAAPKLRSVQEVARASGTTSRTLRHYDEIGLVPPTRIGSNGYRYYDDRALVRLQRVLLLRELGLGLDAIARVIAAQDEQAEQPAHVTPASPRQNARGAADRVASTTEAEILQSHLDILRRERARITTQIGAVQRTIDALTRTTNPDHEGDLMTENMFEGFDHTVHREEVERRWGSEAYASGDRWWRRMSEAERAGWQERSARLGADWIAAAERGTDPASPEAQELADRHVDWLRSIPGTPAARPGATDEELAAYVCGLGDMYVADERFAANYGGTRGAVFVRDALRSYTESNLRADA